MTKIFHAILLICLAPCLLQAELSPSAYEAMQAKAPEYLKIEVLRVDVGPGANPAEQKVMLVANVQEVLRSASDLKPGDIVNITYTVTEHPRGWAGPGAVPIPVERDQSVAYLAKKETGDYEPAAGRMTFSNF